MKALPSGQDAGIITNLPSCKELIDQIMREFNIAAENFKKLRKNMSVETSISNNVEIILDCPPVNALTSTEWLDLATNIDNLLITMNRVILISARGKGFCWRGY